MLRVSVNPGICNSVFWAGGGGGGGGRGAPWSGTGCAEVGRTALAKGGLLATALAVCLRWAGMLRGCIFLPCPTGNVCDL